MNEEHEIVGYHGTTNESAINILNTQNIDDSIDSEDWLGRGKYFYDRYTNAIEYIMRKYDENSEISKSISYNNLVNNYSILKAEIKCKEEDILNLDEIVTLSKFIWAWEKIYNVVKDNEEFKKLEFRDGYMIDCMINEIVNYKIVVKTFDRLFKYIQNRRKRNVVFDKTRIVYEIKQKYICIKDEACIGKIVKIEDNYDKEYNDISKLKKSINRRLNYEV